MDELTIFIERLKKININLELFTNYPWIYIDKINGKKVTERFQGKYGFTLAFLPIRINEKLKLTDKTEIFKLIRKYLDDENKSKLVD